MKTIVLSFMLLFFLTFYMTNSHHSYATTIGGHLGPITIQMPFMKTNSNATITMRYMEYLPHNSTIDTSFLTYNYRSTGLESLTSNDLTIQSDPQSINLLENHTVTYTIVAKNNIKGLYGMAPVAFHCGRYPIAIGLNESEIMPSTLFRLSMPIHCPAIPSDAPVREIIHYDGIILKNVTRTQDQFSPIEQIQLGSNSTDVQCRQGFELIIKTHDQMPACIKPDTAQKLIERGWTMSATDLKPWVKIDTQNLNNTYVVKQPISFSVTVKGFGDYPCVSPQIEIHDNKNPTVSVFEDNGSTMSCPALRTSDNYSFDFPEKNSNYVIILNKTGDYTMTVSYGDHSVQKYFSVVLPSDPKEPSILENDAGIVLLKNQTYYFDTPNYTNDVYTHPVEVSFHDVIFTLFPSGFRGGLPTSCGSQYYWTDAKFSDDTSERLHIFAGSQCPVLPLPIYFSNHTNPQAGLTFYDGKMKLLVDAPNKLQRNTSSTMTNGDQNTASVFSITSGGGQISLSPTCPLCTPEYFNETTTYTGNVGTIIPGYPVFVKISDPYSMSPRTDQISTHDILPNGTFHYTINVTGKFGTNQYTLHFIYGNQSITETLPVLPP